MAARLPAAERRRQLLDVALDVFSRQGFHDASMNDIADAAGVTKPVLYQHFGSKRDLYLEVLRDVGSRLRDAVGKAVAAATGPRDQVTQGMRAYFRWVDANRGGFQVLFTGDTRLDRDFLREQARVEHEVAAGIAGLIDVDGLDDERRLLLAFGIVGMAESTCRRWLAGHAGGAEVAADEIADQVTALAWGGLRGLRPGSTAR